MLPICATVFGLAVVALLAFSPHLHPFVQKAFAWSFWSLAGLCGASIVSPVDPLPDFVPVLGQLDDVAAVRVALASGITGAIVNRRANRALEAGERA